MKEQTLPSPATDRLMTEAEVELFIGWKAGSISRMRARGDRHLPPYIRAGARSIRYRRSAVEAFLDSRTVDPRSTQD